MSSDAQSFWSWFEGRANSIASAGVKVPESVLDEIEAHLHEYCDSLFFEVGGHPDSPERELIITAEGAVQHFPKVRELVTLAPIIRHWNIIAFKPAQGFDFTMERDGITFRAEEFWCKAVGGGASPRVSLRIGMPQHGTVENGRLLWVCEMLLFTGLGEEAATERIKSLEICALPTRPAAEGYFPLRKLSEVFGIEVSSGDA